MENNGTLLKNILDQSWESVRFRVRQHSLKHSMESRALGPNKLSISGRRSFAWKSIYPFLMQNCRFAWHTEVDQAWRPSSLDRSGI